MERDGGGTLETRRASNPLVVDKAGRKPLFANSNSRDGSARDTEQQTQARQNGSSRYKPPIDGLTSRTRSDPAQFSTDRWKGSTAGQTPGGSRLPQAKGSSLSHRKTLSIADAYKLAEQEEASEPDQDQDFSVDASPSPAPRTWRSRLDDKAKATAAGRELAKITQGEGTSQRWRSKSDFGEQGPEGFDGQFGLTDGEVRIPALVPGIEDLPFPSPEGQGSLASPMRRHGAAASPEKSNAWDIDQDFTAGDLQVSDSPRLKVDNRPFANRRAFDANNEININSNTRLNPSGSQNTKLDDIWALERQAGDIDVPKSFSPRKNHKIEDIEARETEVASQIPIPERRLSERQNHKIDAIKQRELEGLSKRQLASTRLGEIREQNSLFRSTSPEETKAWAAKSSPRDRVAESRPEGDTPARRKSAFETQAERVGGTPAATHKSRQQGERDVAKSSEDKSWRTTSDPVRPEASHSRKHSSDALRQLPRRTSYTPAPETAAQRRATASEKNSDSSEPRSRFARRAARNGKKGNNNNKDNRDGSGDSKRLTVGFAGLKRVQSTESTNSKRSSMHSETDPTERLEAELQLFAPADNYSEPGSVRAQSPASESDNEKMAEATPKPKKHDPLSMPTPKITGAYVETPATVRVEKTVPEDETEADLTMKAEESRGARSSSDSRPSPSLRRRSSSLGSRNRDTSSDPGANETHSADEGGSRRLQESKVAALRKPRARSLSRRRPPLRNTAKPPSVKDDMLELHRLHNVEDSTLDDLEEILTGQKAPSSSKVEEVLRDLPVQPELGEEVALDVEKAALKAEVDDIPTVFKAEPYQDIKEEENSDEDLATYDRMSKSLRTVSLGIRTAKQGIERLEDRFTSSQPEKPALTIMDAHTLDHHHCPACAAQPGPSALAYIHVPVPRLFHREPTFRFTLLGLIIFITSLWYATESAMCATYCRPKSCDPSSGPCIWSFDDPMSFGSALPIKVDQWVTRGYGRKRFDELYERLDDFAADVQDAALGRHITEIDVDSLLTPERRLQHRRRLRKKGLLKNRVNPSPEDRATWASWHRVRVEADRAREAREMGYSWEEEGEGSVGGDMPIRHGGW